MQTDTSVAKIASASVAAACWLRGRPRPDYGLMSGSFRRVIRRVSGELLYACMYALARWPCCVHMYFIKYGASVVQYHPLGELSSTRGATSPSHFEILQTRFVALIQTPRVASSRADECVCLSGLKLHIPRSICCGCHLPSRMAASCQTGA
jgi:hypothetical protein